MLTCSAKGTSSSWRRARDMAVDATGRRIPVATSTSGRVLEHGRPERISTWSRSLGWLRRCSASQTPARRFWSQCSTGEPGLGVLAAFDRGVETAPFTPEDEQLLRTFAASAAQAVALNRSVEADRLREHDCRRRTPSAAAGPGSCTTRPCSRWAACGWRWPRCWAEAMRPPRTRRFARRSKTTSSSRSPTSGASSPTCDCPCSITSSGAGDQALLDRRCDAGLEVVGEVALGDLASGERGLDPQLETTIYRLVRCRPRTSSSTLKPARCACPSRSSRAR